MRGLRHQTLHSQERVIAQNLRTVESTNAPSKLTHCAGSTAALKSGCKQQSGCTGSNDLLGTVGATFTSGPAGFECSASLTRLSRNLLHANLCKQHRGEVAYTNRKHTLLHAHRIYGFRCQAQLASSQEMKDNTFSSVTQTTPNFAQAAWPGCPWTFLQHCHSQSTKVDRYWAASTAKIPVAQRVATLQSLYTNISR